MHWAKWDIPFYVPVTQEHKGKLYGYFFEPGAGSINFSRTAVLLFYKIWLRLSAAAVGE